MLFGATGFTGQLVAQYLADNHARLVDGEGLRWAIAGRNRAKLERVRQDLAEREPALEKLDLIVADSSDADSLAQMASQAEVVCSTVGPYSK